MQPIGGENLGLWSNTQEDYWYYGFCYRRNIKTSMMANV